MPGAVEVPLDFSLVPEPDEVVVLEQVTQEAEPVTEPATETEQSVVPPKPALLVITERPS